jgi:nucleotide-binding universal stress UspA family protein
MQINKILVATDFSEHARLALQYGAEFSKKFSADVIICHIVQKPELLSQIPPGGESYFPPNLAEQHEALAREHCAKLLQEAEISGGQVEIRHGSPFVEIIGAARDQQAYLLILGTHGRGAVAHLLMGSVAEKVVRKAPCPVLTVHSGERKFQMP